METPENWSGAGGLGVAAPPSSSLSCEDINLLRKNNYIDGKKCMILVLVLHVPLQ